MKPGWKTSEFWLSISAMLLPLVIPHLGEAIGKAPEGSWMAILGPPLVAAAYALSRGLAKKELPPDHQALLIDQKAIELADRHCAGLQAAPAQYVEGSTRSVTRDDEQDGNDTDLAMYQAQLVMEQEAKYARP